MSELTHSQYSIKAVDAIFQLPILTVPLFEVHSEIPKPTASRIIGAARAELPEGLVGRVLALFVLESRSTAKAISGFTLTIICMPEGESP